MANLRNIFTRYREVIFYVLLILVCLGLLVAARYYRHYKWIKNNPISVYDLTWPDRADANEAGDEGDVVYRRWRYYIETKTNLPRKIKKYSTRDPNDEYVLEETLIVSYPTDEQIRAVIKDANF